MPTFAHIQEEIANILNIPENELTEEQTKLIDIYLNELGQQEADKIDGFASFIRQQSAIAETIKKESQHLKDKSEAMQNKIDRFKNHYLSIMRNHGLKKISGEVYSIAVRESSRVNVSNLDALVKDNNPVWIKTEVTYKPDKTAIKEALKDGIDVPGCQLEKGFSLNIR